VKFSYWDEQGRITAQPMRVRRIIVEISLPRSASKAIREMSLRT
jgi:hypothetical protein